MAETAPYSKMEKLMFEAGIHDGLKQVQRETAIRSYIILINVNRGYQMKNGKKIKYTANDGTIRILEAYFRVPWTDIFEDKSGEATKETSKAPSTEKAISETFKVSSKK